MEEFVYWLKFEEYRSKIDLIDYDTEITCCVNSVFPNIPVYIDREMFSFYADELTRRDAQIIGELIAQTTNLGKYVTSYHKEKTGKKYSGQLFIRKNSDS